MDEDDIKNNLQTAESSQAGRRDLLLLCSSLLSPCPQMTSSFVATLDGLGVNTAAWGPSMQHRFRRACMFGRIENASFLLK